MKKKSAIAVDFKKILNAMKASIDKIKIFIYAKNIPVKKKLIHFR